jgi:LysM repeat protein
MQAISSPPVARTASRATRSHRPHPAPEQWRGGNRSTASAQLLPVRLLVLLIALSAAVLLFSARVSADQPEALDTHVVTQGDTLWGIAAEVTPAGEDIRATIGHIRELNDLDGATILPGQRIVVPAG